MNERDSFIRRICEEPADDTARLVFADWLEEHGEPERAEFIRLGCHLEQLLPGEIGPTNVEIYRTRRRLRAILKAKHAEWDLGLPGQWMVSEFRHEDSIVLSTGGRSLICRARLLRGFVSHIDLPVEDFLTHARTVFSRHPVTAVALWDKTPQNHRAHGSDGKGFGWCGCDPGPYSRLLDVPIELVRLMRESPRLLNRSSWLGWADFETEAIAQEELSIACVILGRREAELPELPRADAGALTRQG